MNRIERIFQDLRGSGRRALMPFVCAGRPPGRLGDLLAALEAAGASIVEIGFPFSDPIADGPVISGTMQRALRDGVTAPGALAELEACRGRIEIGLVAMVSVSLVTRLGGAAGFARRAASAGFDGLIVPDCPLEEADELVSSARDANLTLSLLVAPSTPPDRIAAIAGASTGFIYLLAQAGVTGERAAAPDVAGAVQAVRGATDLPIACGFGISTAEQVRAVVRHADAAIVGSALARRIDEASDTGRDPVLAAGAFVRELATGLPA